MMGSKRIRSSFAPEKRPRSTGRCNPAPGIGYSITRVHIIPGSDGKPRSFLLCFEDCPIQTADSSHSFERLRLGPPVLKIRIGDKLRTLDVQDAISPVNKWTSLEEHSVRHSEDSGIHLWVA